MNNDEKYLKRLKDTIDIGNILQENIQRDKELFSKFKAYSSSLSVFPEYGKLPDSLTFNISSLSNGSELINSNTLEKTNDINNALKIEEENTDLPE